MMSAMNVKADSLTQITGYLEKNYVSYWVNRRQSTPSLAV